MRDLGAATNRMAQIIGGFLNEEKPVIEHTVMFALVVFESGPPGTSQPVHYASNATVAALTPVLEGVLKQVKGRQADPFAITIPSTP